MKNIKVTLLHYNGIGAALAALSKPYKKDNLTQHTLQKVTKEFKHESLLEHIVFTFDITGSSRLELQEHMRHRIASPTVESTRYTLTKGLLEDYKIYETTGEIDLVEKYLVTPFKYENDIEFYHMQHDTLDILVKALKKYPQDYAKYFLPESFRTSFVWTINMRSLLNFLRLRTSTDAHVEIRYIAGLIYREVSNTPAGLLLD